MARESRAAFEARSRDRWTRKFLLERPPEPWDVEAEVQKDLAAARKDGLIVADEALRPATETGFHTKEG